VDSEVVYKDLGLPDKGGVGWRSFAGQRADGVISA